MKLVVKCCCCGVEQSSMEVPFDPAVVRAETWWTRTPCEPCEKQLAAEDAARAYGEGWYLLPADLQTKLAELYQRGVDIPL